MVQCEQNDETLYSIYTWDKNAFTQINGEQLIEGKRHPSIFFENTDYQFWINFKRIDIEDAWINTPLSECIFIPRINRINSFIILLYTHASLRLLKYFIIRRTIDH